MNFCSSCGAKVELSVPVDDNRQRSVCTSCEEIHYENPKIICGSLPIWQDKILLCKRAIEPRSGYWTLPAGFMELNETSVEAAVRETWEEATAKITPKQLYCVFNLPHVNQVYLMYLADMQSIQYSPGIESESVELFDADSIPWDELAFSTIRMTLKFYLNDRTTNNFPVHTGAIIKKDESRFDFAPEP